jgi:3-oxoacyl-[acyl-carrier protein] reductase
LHEFLFAALLFQIFQTSMTTDFPYKTAWITGASRGIGLAIAAVLARRGVNVALSGRDAETLAEAISTIQSTMQKDSIARVRIVPVVCDVARTASIESAYSMITSILGEPSLLINNAGVGIFTPFLETSLDDIESMLNTNLRGALLAAHVAARSMAHVRHGAIVNINSVAALKTFSNSSVYAASKAGLLAASRVIREELREHSVKVIDVMVGATETAIWNEAARENFRERMMQPEDIAEAVLAVLEMPPRLMPEEFVLRPQTGDL